MIRAFTHYANSECVERYALLDTDGNLYIINDTKSPPIKIDIDNKVVSFDIGYGLICILDIEGNIYIYFIYNGKLLNIKTLPEKKIIEIKIGHKNITAMCSDQSVYVLYDTDTIVPYWVQIHQGNITIKKFYNGTYYIVILGINGEIIVYPHKEIRTQYQEEIRTHYQDEAAMWKNTMDQLVKIDGSNIIDFEYIDNKMVVLMSDNNIYLAGNFPWNYYSYSSIGLGFFHSGCEHETLYKILLAENLYLLSKNSKLLRVDLYNNRNDMLEITEITEIPPELDLNCAHNIYYFTYGNQIINILSPHGNYSIHNPKLTNIPNFTYNHINMMRILEENNIQVHKQITPTKSANNVFN